MRIWRDRLFIFAVYGLCALALSRPYGISAGEYHCSHIVAISDDAAVSAVLDIGGTDTVARCMLRRVDSVQAMNAAKCDLAASDLRRPPDECPMAVQPKFWRWSKPYSGPALKPLSSYAALTFRRRHDFENDLTWVDILQDSQWQTVGAVLPNRRIVGAYELESHILVVAEIDMQLGSTQESWRVSKEDSRNENAQRKNLIHHAGLSHRWEAYRHATRLWTAAHQLDPLSDQELVAALCSAAENTKSMRQASPYYARLWFEGWAAARTPAEINVMKKRVAKHECAFSMATVLDSIDDPLKGLHTWVLQALKMEQVASLNTEQLRLLRNTIYARHGRSFRDPELQKYFGRFPWYNRALGDVILQHGLRTYDVPLSDLDRQNLAILKTASQLNKKR